jgi:hypothetical protein
MAFFELIKNENKVKSNSNKQFKIGKRFKNFSKSKANI